VPQLDPLHAGQSLMAVRTNREKVAILLSALSKDTAVNLLKKLDTGSIRNLMDGAGDLGDLNARDVEPLVAEFSLAFSTALGISAGAEHLFPLLEAAFPQQKFGQLLGTPEPVDAAAIWSKFDAGAETTLVPFLLDEHEQTAALILSKLPVDIAAKCFALLPREITPRLLMRTMSLRPPAADALAILENVLEEHFFMKPSDDAGSFLIERVASVVNRLERNAALSILDSLSATAPEQTGKLRKHIFMFEDLSAMDAKSRARLFDRVAAELVTPAIWGMEPAFKDAVLSVLSARARRMVESELAADTGEPHSGSAAARKKIAETAVIMGRKGEITLPDLTQADAKVA
jgi:flagellar motor switch protein FliG